MNRLLHFFSVWQSAIAVGIILSAISILSAQTAAPMNHAKNDTKSLHTIINLPFAPTEQLIYDVNYSRFLFRGLNVAEIKFNASTSPLAINKQTENLTDAATELQTTFAPMVFTSDITSQGFFVKLFGKTFSYHLESIVDPTLFATERTHVSDEQGKRKRTGEAVFDRKEQRVTWMERDPNEPAKPPRVVTNTLDDSRNSITNDLLTAIYYLRAQSFAAGRSFVLSTSHNGVVYKVPVKVIERTQTQSPFGKVSAWRLEFDVFGENRLIGGEGSMTAWLTDDARHLPVRAKLSSDWGTVEITLKQVKSSEQSSQPTEAKLRSTKTD